MSIGSGRGKTILFGEHFVVYGMPSVAAGISSVTIAKVSRTDSPGWTIDDRRPAVPGYKEKKLNEQRVSIDNIMQHVCVDLSTDGVYIELEGDLTCASGFGASAASCVAIARAMNEEYGLGLNDDEINRIAYEGERGYHGTPSGLDNTASTYGGLIWYIRDLSGGPPKFETLRLKKPMYLVIASTGLTASTTEVVGDVRAKKEKNPEWFSSIAKDYTILVHKARDALFSLDAIEVGKQMNRNHELLQSLTVSCDELDNLVTIARDNGAIGAKMTGTGRGGNQISLAPDEVTMIQIADVLKKSGAAFVQSTTFGI